MRVSVHHSMTLDILQGSHTQIEQKGTDGETGKQACSINNQSNYNQKISQSTINRMNSTWLSIKQSIDGNCLNRLAAVYRQLIV